jgi:hypothetical protein
MFPLIKLWQPHVNANSRGHLTVHTPVAQAELLRTSRGRKIYWGGRERHFSMVKLPYNRIPRDQKCLLFRQKFLLYIDTYTLLDKVDYTAAYVPYAFMVYITNQNLALHITSNSNSRKHNTKQNVVDKKNTSSIGMSEVNMRTEWPPHYASTVCIRAQPALNDISIFKTRRCGL